MTRRGMFALGLALAVIAAAVVGIAHGRTQPSQRARRNAAIRAPDGQRVRVQVLNATSVRGLAMRATRLLRDDGFDVVEVGTSAQARATTLVLDRSAHPDWARRVAAALDATVAEAPDSSRYVDITVLLGASWRPPPQPFYP